MSPAAAASPAARFEAIAGAAAVHTEPGDLARYGVDGAIPKFVVRPANAEEAAETVRAAAEEKLGVLPCGNRSKLAIGMPPAAAGVALDLSRLTGIVHYDPGDLTVSVQAGTPLRELAAALAEKNQFLPLAVPFFAQATVAGAVAAGLDSPLRHFYGTPRDFLLGAEFIDGTGARAKSGGRVVKNVTGYDFHKLLHGSLGTLGVVTQLNFRTFPLPPARRGFLASFPGETGAFAFVREVSRSALTPAVLDILSPECSALAFPEGSPVASLRLDTRAWTVGAGFEGSEEVCDRYARELAGMARSASAQNAVALHDAQFPALLEALREAPANLSRPAHAVVMRLATLPSCVADLLRAVRSFAGSSWMRPAALVRSGSILYLGLAPGEKDETALKQVEYFWKSVGSLRNRLAFHGALLFCPGEWKASLDVWAHARPDLDLERRVKKAFDPAGIFARGRFVGGI